MSELSRRTLVMTSAAALPALAVPAIGSEAIGPNRPDAELLRLGAQLEAVEREWLAQHVRDDAGEPIECDADGDMIPWSRIHERMFGLIDEIMKHKPRTADGLAVQVRAIVMDKAEWWDEGFITYAGEESPHGRTRLLLESTCVFFGISVAAIKRAAEA